MRDIRADIGRASQAYLGIEVGAVHVDLATMLMHQLKNVFNALFVHPVCGRVSDHQAAEPLAGLLGQQAGLEPLMFGLIIVVFIVFEPQGIYGRWMKIRYFFETFPYYRKSSFVRQKSYLKTERMR